MGTFSKKKIKIYETIVIRKAIIKRTMNENIPAKAMIDTGIRKVYYPLHSSSIRGKGKKILYKEVPKKVSYSGYIKYIRDITNRRHGCYGYMPFKYDMEVHGYVKKENGENVFFVTKVIHNKVNV